MSTYELFCFNKLTNTKSQLKKSSPTNFSKFRKPTNSKSQKPANYQLFSLNQGGDRPPLDSHLSQPCKTVSVTRSLHSVARTPPEYQEPVLWNTSFPTGDPRHGRHASRSTGGVCSETRAPGNFRSPRPGTSVSPSSRNNHSGTRTRELKRDRRGEWERRGK